MIHLTFRTQALLMTMPLLTLIASSNTHAEIYKWRDNRGVTQYSDRPPVSSFSKLTPNELVNSLQTKDLCTDGPIKKSATTNVASTKDYNGFFNIFVKANAASPVKNSLIGNIKNNASVNNSIGKIQTNTAVKNLSAPQKSVSTSPSMIGKNVTVLNFNKAITGISPINSVIAAPAPAVKPAAPAATLPAVAPKPVATPAVSPPAASAPPTQVATAPQTSNPTNNLPNIIKVALMPAVDISRNIIPAIGYNTFRTQATTEITPQGTGIGSFRMPCKISHMSNDDPVVYPNQQGAAHHHTFFGNTSVNYKSNLETLATTGNSTCNGGIMNRSAYWIPTIINTENNTPVVPTGDILVYYKTGNIDAPLIKAPPKGLRMIAGNSKAKTASETAWAGFKCHPGPNSKRQSWPDTPYITPPSGCEVGDDLTFFVSFPQCWDGKNLDSPNHQDHMARPHNGSCPATHPVPIPEIGFNVHYIIKAGDKIDKWRLASDNYSTSLPGGYSGHGDWVNGWDEASINGIIKNCLNARKDAHAHLLCDGRSFY